MSEKTLTFDNIRVNMKEFHKSKRPIDLMSVNTEHIVTCDKFKHSDDGFKYFIGYKEGEIVKPLCIILPQLSGYMKYFENGEKNMPFMVKDDDVLDKYHKLWDKIKEKSNIQFHNMPVYDETYIKAKVRQFDGVIKTNFLGNKIPKKKQPLHLHCLCDYWFCYENRKEKLSAGLFRRMQMHSEKCKIAQIHRSWTRIRLRVRFKIKIWHWINGKVRI